MAFACTLLDRISCNKCRACCHCWPFSQALMAPLKLMTSGVTLRCGISPSSRQISSALVALSCVRAMSAAQRPP